MKTPDQENTPAFAWRSFRENLRDFPKQLEGWMKYAFISGVIWGAAKSINEGKRIQNKALEFLDKSGLEILSNESDKEE